MVIKLNMLNASNFGMAYVGENTSDELSHDATPQVTGRSCLMHTLTGMYQVHTKISKAGLSMLVVHILSPIQL